MKRLRWLAFSLMFAPLLAFGAAKFQQGVNYTPIIPAQPTQSPGKIEVIEFFWYGCPHCYDYDPYVEKWLAHKPADVNFIRVPATFRPLWELHARAFYTAQVLGIVDKIHVPLFDAIHKYHKPMDTVAELAAFFQKQAGIDPATFRRTFNSFAVVSKTGEATAMVQRYGITGVPTVVVDGKYMTSASQVHSYADLQELVEFLVAKVRKERAAGDH